MFCTYLTIYRGNKLPPFYVGSSSCARIQNGYHGSVKSRRYQAIWETELLTSPHLFVTKIIALHATRKEAYDAEERLHRQLRIIKNPMHTNLALANRRFNTGEGQTPETRAKIGAACRGKKMPPRSEEYREKQAATKRGKKAAPETRAKMTATHLGKKLGPRDPSKRAATCEKMRASQGCPVIIGGVKYRSITDASEALGISHYLVKKAANALPLS